MIDLHAMEGLVAFGLLIVVIYGPWQWACTDAARQTLFHARDELFDLARFGQLDFSSTEYRTIRESFDRQIRFAHVLGVVRLIVFARLALTAGPKISPVRLAVAQIVDDETRAVVGKLIDRLDSTMIIMMVAKSPLLLGVLLVLLIIKSFTSVVRTSSFNLLGIFRDVATALKSFATEKFAPLIHQEAAAFKI